MRITPTLNTGATFSVSSGSAGTVGSLTGTGYGTGGDSVQIYNTAANWTVGVAVSITAGINAEL